MERRVWCFGGWLVGEVPRSLGNTRDVLQGVAPVLSALDVERTRGRVVIVNESDAGGAIKPFTRTQLGHVVEFVGGWWVTALTCGSPPISVADYCEMTNSVPQRVYESQAFFRRAFPGMKTPTDLALELGFDLSTRSADDVPGVVLAMLKLLGQ